MMLPEFPIYIVSKGRSDIQTTGTHLAKLGVPHYFVVEESQADDYRRRLPMYSRVLVLDPVFQDRYETCDALGRSKSVGSGAARNFAWEHAISSGYPWHWVGDDNIKGFYRWSAGNRNILGTPTFLYIMEQIASAYSNVAMAGPNYKKFAIPSIGASIYPVTVNTRLFSFNLIRNNITQRWRGRFNEDAILSLDILKAGHCTIQFNEFLQEKEATQVMRGGNTDELYKHGTWEKSDMLVRMHPDVARHAYKFSRDHHYVDYSRFLQKPILTEERPNLRGLVDAMKLLPVKESVYA